MKTRMRDVFMVACLMIFVIGLSGCGKKGEYKGFVPVTKAEAETFATQLVEKFKQGDKKPFFDFGTNYDASDAFAHLTNPDIDAQMKEVNAQMKAAGMQTLDDMSAEQRKTLMDGIVTMNHAYFDSLKSVEFVETKEELGIMAVVIDCQFDQTSKLKLKEQKFTLMLLKKKSTGEIVVASHH